MTKEIKSITFLRFIDENFIDEFQLRYIVRREDCDGNIFYYEGGTLLKSHHVERDLYRFEEGLAFLEGKGKTLNPSSFTEEDWDHLGWAVARWFPRQLNLSRFNWKKHSWAIAQYCPVLINDKRFRWNLETFYIVYQRSPSKVPEKVVDAYIDDFYDYKYGDSDYY